MGPESAGFGRVGQVPRGLRLELRPLVGVVLGRGAVDGAVAVGDPGLEAAVEEHRVVDAERRQPLEGLAAALGGAAVGEHGAPAVGAQLGAVGFERVERDAARPGHVPERAVELLGRAQVEDRQVGGVAEHRERHPGPHREALGAALEESPAAAGGEQRERRQQENGRRRNRPPQNDLTASSTVS
jgi:hypothetical protein